MKKFIKLYLITAIVFTAMLTMVVITYEKEITKINTKNSEAIALLETEHMQEIETITAKNDEEILKLKTYEYLYTENKLDLDKSTLQYKSLKAEYDDFKENIAYMKTNSGISRSGTSDLTTFQPITADELNDWILAKAPKGSPFIGNAEAFIKASKESGLDPKYLVAHAALESAWGKSNIAKIKNNFFGIGSYNASPTKSSYSFNSTVDGIVSGAKWISDNYTNKGQNTLEKMIYGKKAYCVTDGGIPDSKWITKISSIMKDA